MVLLRETGSPTKQTDSSVDAPPNALQKSVFDSQRSESLLVLELVGTPARPCKEGAKGELTMVIFWHVSHTVEQKSVAAWLDCGEFSEVELQRRGTDLGVELTIYRSPENGSHLCRYDKEDKFGLRLEIQIPQVISIQDDHQTSPISLSYKLMSISGYYAKVNPYCKQT